MITVFSEDGTDSETITVTITGVNGAAVISGDNDGDVVEDTTLTASGSSVSPTRTAARPSGAGPGGDGGRQRLRHVRGRRRRGVDLHARQQPAAVQSLPAGATLTDMITVVSEDGTDSETITVTITGVDDAPPNVTPTANNDACVGFVGPHIASGGDDYARVVP